MNEQPVNSSNFSVFLRHELNKRSLDKYINMLQQCNIQHVLRTLSINDPELLQSLYEEFQKASEEVLNMSSMAHVMNSVPRCEDI